MMNPSFFTIENVNIKLYLNCEIINISKRSFTYKL